MTIFVIMLKFCCLAFSGILHKCKTVVTWNRTICQRKCQQIVSRKQMWFDHKESCRLHNSKGLCYSIYLFIYNIDIFLELYIIRVYFIN